MVPLVVLITLVNVCLGLHVQDCRYICPDIYSPMCGSDGVTYFNKCFFDVTQCHDSSLTLAHPGVCGSGGLVVQKKAALRSFCSNIGCFDNYDPVCGTDGKTYGNACYLKREHCHGEVTMAHYGACGIDEHLVSKKALDCPLMWCAALYDPVCGTDGMTYGNACMLHTQYCHGEVTVAYHGVCM